MVPDNKDCRASIWIRHPMQQQCKTHHILSGLSEAYPVDSGQGSVRPCVLCPYIPKVGNMGNDITWGFLGDMGIFSRRRPHKFQLFSDKKILKKNLKNV